MAWRKSAINRRFLNNLRREFEDRIFTNKLAYTIYMRDHREANSEDTYWAEMNARNTLCAAAFYDELKRLGPGVYQFPS